MGVWEYDYLLVSHFTHMHTNAHAQKTTNDALDSSCTVAESPSATIRMYVCLVYTATLITMCFVVCKSVYCIHMCCQLWS